LIAHFQAALKASQEASQAQNYPKGALYVVATPIGNLADITLRALHVLQLVDVIACEDTRHTHTLLQAYGVELRSEGLLALHQHNEREAAQSVVAKLRAGARVAYVSDAGTPAISDPGARLVAEVVQAGLRVIPIPGVSSLTTALSVAGMPEPHIEGVGGFIFAGFLPTSKSERAAALEAIQAEPRSVVLLEAPHRMSALARELGLLGERSITVCRELTKQFEEVVTLPSIQLASWVSEDSHRVKGEFVLVIHPVEGEGVGGAMGDRIANSSDRVLRALMEELPLKTAVKLAAELTGAPRNALYEQALAIKSVQG